MACRAQDESKGTVRGMAQPPVTPVGASDVLGALVDQVAARAAELVLERLRTMPGFGVPRYATAENNPLGSARAFLDDHRAGRFASFKLGRHIAARWEDVEAWAVTKQSQAEERRTAKRASEASGDAALAAELDKACGPKRRRAA